MGELEAGEDEFEVEPFNAPGMRRRWVPAAIRQLKRPPTLTGWVVAGPGHLGAVCPGEEIALTFAVESRGWVVGRGVRAGDPGGVSARVYSYQANFEGGMDAYSSRKALGAFRAGALDSDKRRFATV